MYGKEASTRKKETKVYTYVFACVLTALEYLDFSKIKKKTEEGKRPSQTEREREKEKTQNSERW